MSMGGDFNNTLSSLFSSHTDSKLGKIMVIELIKQSSDAPANMICLGRAENNDIIIASNTVSKLHAYFLKTSEGDDYEIVDANSTNGTKLNDRRLFAYQKQPLVDGDRLQFGPVAEAMYLSATGFYSFIREIQQSGIALMWDASTGARNMDKHPSYDQSACLSGGRKKKVSCATSKLRRNRCDQGYTVVELLAVIAIVSTLTAITVPVSKDYYYQAQITRTIAEIRVIEKEILVYEQENDRYPVSLADIKRGTLLDPWKNPYQYLNIADSIKQGNGHPQGARKDKHEVPLNDDYDLYSVGIDGKTKAPLMNAHSYDDIVRASNGDYVGLAAEYW